MNNNFNSIKNQEIKAKFIQREVFSSVNGMVEYILQKSYEDAEVPFSWDDITNLYVDNTEAIEELQNEKVILEDVEEQTMENDNRIEQIENEIEELEQEQENQQEVYEWWQVSSYLARKLKEYGEPIIEGENIWGRCTTGQAILLDNVISQICNDMEILEGQRNANTDNL